MDGKRVDQDTFFGFDKKDGQGFKQQLSLDITFRLLVHVISDNAYVPNVFSAQKQSNVECQIP